MTEPNGSGVVLKWAHLLLILTIQVLMLGAVYGSLKFQVEDHARRLEAIEKNKMRTSFRERSMIIAIKTSSDRSRN